MCRGAEEGAAALAEGEARAAPSLVLAVVVPQEAHCGGSWGCGGVVVPQVLRLDGVRRLGHASGEIVSKSPVLNVRGAHFFGTSLSDL